MSLPGEGWHASLMSLTVLDKGQSNAVIATDPHTKVIKLKMTYVIRKYVINSYRRVQTKTVDCELELEENADQTVTSGSLLWKRVMQEVHNKIMRNVMNEQKQFSLTNRDERPIVSVKKNAMPQFDLERRCLGDSCYSQNGFVEREQNRHDGVLYQSGHCAQVWLGGRKDHSKQDLV